MGREGEGRRKERARGASGEERGRREEALGRVEAVVERDEAIGGLPGGRQKAAPFDANREERGERNGGFGSETSSSYKRREKEALVV